MPRVSQQGRRGRSHAPGTDRQTTGVTDEWQEIGDRVYVRRHESVLLNCGLVVGDGQCLVIDTRSHAQEGRALEVAVREITMLPWVVVNTHAHFDHCYGNVAFEPASFWAHPGCRSALIDHGETQKERAAARYRAEGRPDFADAIEATPLVLPKNTVESEFGLLLGQRLTLLSHFGRGHTDHDLVVSVPDAGVVFAGDLVEEGADPAFEDAFPLEWPAALDGLLELTAADGAQLPVVVPGHGRVVDPGFVRAQRDTIAAIAAAAQAGHAAGLPADEVAADTSTTLRAHAAEVAVARTYWQLDGEPPERD